MFSKTVKTISILIMILYFFREIVFGRSEYINHVFDNLVADEFNYYMIFIIAVFLAGIYVIYFLIVFFSRHRYKKMSARTTVGKETTTIKDSVSYRHRGSVSYRRQGDDDFPKETPIRDIDFEDQEENTNKINIIEENLKTNEIISKYLIEIDEVTRIERNRFSDISIYEGQYYSTGDLSGAKKISDLEPLCMGERYTLEVAIRQNRLGIGADQLTPRAVLNPRKTTEPLKVFLVVRSHDPRIVVREPVADITWPFDSDSGSALFRISVEWLQSDPGQAAVVDVCLYHANLDLLDTVQAHLRVGQRPGASPFPHELKWVDSPKAQPRLAPDEAVRNLSIHVRRGEGGFIVDFTILRGGHSMTLVSERRLLQAELERLLTRVRDFWAELAIRNYGSQISVTDTSWQRHLTALSQLGADAWELLFGSRAGSQRGASEVIGDLIHELDFAEGTHIQVVYDPQVIDFVFPWSILHPPLASNERVNPLNFWGARYQIEQVREGANQDGLDCDPVNIELAIDPRFHESEAELMMFQRFRNSSEERIRINERIDTETSLHESLASSPAQHLYYFFCHGYAPAGPPALRREGVRALRDILESLDSDQRRPWDQLLTLTADISDEAWMFVANAHITESALRRRRDFFNRRRPIIFLNMCQSAALMPSMMGGFVRLFLERDAAAVIGTESPMSSVFAHAFADVFFGHLLAGKDLGTSLWLARRHFLADDVRNPLGLAYTLYGRATTRIGAGAPIRPRPELRANLC